MRQLSRDQLITTLRYQLGRLGPSARKKLVSRDQAVRMRWAEIVAETIADQALHRFEIYGDDPVSRADVIAELRPHIASLRTDVLQMLDSHDARTRVRGADIIAAILTDKALVRYEILTDAPLPPGEQPGITVNGRLE